MKHITDTYTLNNGVLIPCVGFGTWQTPDGDVAYESVLKALEVGYTHIDTAAIYGNEASVGRAIRDSGIKRDQLFITTKLWNDKGFEKGTLEGFEESMDKLQLDYLDLYLIHWPNPIHFRENWKERNAETWATMEGLLEQQKTRAIGVSNFQIHHLETLEQTLKVTPQVNQIRLCPGDKQSELVTYCEDKKILLEAYSPLGTGKIFEVELMKTLAEKYETTVANIALKWNIQHGFLPLPKSVTPSRIEANAKFLHLELTDEDMAKIDGLEGVCGYHADPDVQNW
jgi:diketogulonate reductase-like aldo/keto reductase